MFESKFIINESVSIKFISSFLKKLTKAPSDIEFIYKDDEKVKMTYLNKEYDSSNGKTLYLYESENKKVRVIIQSCNDKIDNEIARLLRNIEDRPAEEYLLNSIKDFAESPKDIEYLIVIKDFNEVSENKIITGYGIYDLHSLPGFKEPDGFMTVSLRDFLNKNVYKTNIIDFITLVIYYMAYGKSLPEFPYLLYRGRRVQRLIRFHKA